VSEAIGISTGATNHNTRQCLWHGDFRLDNMLFDAQGGSRLN
jgi:aminoglycoside phosphotransferase (APT) family kinase protein